MKKIIIVGVIATILVAIILNLNNIYRFYKLNQIRNYYINELNGKFNNKSNPKKTETYKRYQKSIEELNHYDITKLVDKYIEIAEESVKIHSSGVNKRFLGGFEKINERKNLSYGKDIWMTRSGDLCIEDNIADKDIANYNNGIFKDKLVEKLRTCLDYKEKEGRIEWQINSTEDMRIELPYDCYIDYTAYHREDNKEFKKVVDVIFDKNFDLNKKENKAIVKYETIDGKTKEIKVSTYHILIDNEEYYDIDYYGILVIDADNLAEAYLSSHTVDRKKEENELRIIGEWFDN